MILADTSIWVQHFRRGLPEFSAALDHGRISIHPVVLGELASGNLANRAETLADLQRLPGVKAARTEECLHFIEAHVLYGRGIGWNDIQLLVAATLSHHQLWSRDARLAAAAAALHIAYLV